VSGKMTNSERIRWTGEVRAKSDSLTHAVLRRWEDRMDWLENQKRFPGYPSEDLPIRSLLRLIAVALLRPDAWLV
jgi:hypothetical protein